MKTMLKFVFGVLVGLMTNWMLVVYFSKFGILRPLNTSREVVDESNLTDLKSVYQNGIKEYIGYINTLDTRSPNSDLDQYLKQNTTEAVALYSKVRILCRVFVKVENLQRHARAINNTWGRHCNKLLFFSSHDEPSLPVIKLNITEGREFLFQKTIAAFRYVYENHLNDADFFLKADDDAFVVVENLRYYLESRDPEVPAWYGRKFKHYTENGYMSGGAGYVLSKGALRSLYTDGRDIILCYIPQQSEDVGLGRCLNELNVPRIIAVDNRNNTRMHFFDVVDHVMGNYPPWVAFFDDFRDKFGYEHISEYAITFHYIKTAEQFYGFYNTLYHIKVFGKSSYPRDLN